MSSSEARPIRPCLFVFVAVALFVSVYLGAFLLLGYAAAFAGVPHFQWVSLISVSVATAVTVAIAEGGRWRLGLFVAPRLAAREFALGLLLAVVLIVTTDALIILTTPMRHTRGLGFPWRELVLVFLPAAVHEELLFRGYVFQKIRTCSRAAAVAITSIVFALMHGPNAGITGIAMLNLLGAGVLLAFAYERYQRLWFPIGIHLAWNLLSGPILGYDVSGYVAASTVFHTAGAGPSWLTGGVFGIEGSAWMFAVELAAVILLARRVESLPGREVPGGI